MSGYNPDIEPVIIGCDAGTGISRTVRVILVHASMVEHIPSVCNGLDADVVVIDETASIKPELFDMLLPVVELREVYLEDDQPIHHEYQLNKFEHMFEQVFVCMGEHGIIRIRSPGMAR